MNVGNKAYELVCELFPICRSITGNGSKADFGSHKT